MSIAGIVKVANLRWVGLYSMANEVTSSWSEHLRRSQSRFDYRAIWISHSPKNSRDNLFEGGGSRSKKE